MYIIPITIIIFCLLIIAYIISRRFHQLILIDVESIPEEKEKKMKDKIMVDRIRRTASAEFVKIEKSFLPFVDWAKKYFEKIYNKFLELEKKYQEKIKKKPLDEDAKEKLRALHNMADDYLKKGDLENAESKYFEIIRVAHKKSGATTQSA